MRVQDIMTTGVQVIGPTMTAEAAWELMRLKGLRHLIVKDGDRLIGVLSDRDGGGARGAPLRKNHVADLMTRGVITVSPDTTVKRAANVMRGRSIGCLVVAAGDHAVGIVTVADLLELYGRGGERSVEVGKRWTLSHRVPHRKRHGVVKAW